MTLPAIDYTDPDALLRLLRPAYYALLGGAGVAHVVIEGRNVAFQQSNITMLKAEIATLEIESAAKNGKPSPRRAMRAGSLARGWTS